jgi:hypothetical protein
MHLNGSCDQGRGWVECKYAPIGHDLVLIDILVDNHMELSGVNRLPPPAADPGYHLTSTAELNDPFALLKNPTAPKRLPFYASRTDH